MLPRRNSSGRPWEDDQPPRQALYPGYDSTPPFVLEGTMDQSLYDSSEVIELPSASFEDSGEYDYEVEPSYSDSTQFDVSDDYGPVENEPEPDGIGYLRANDMLSFNESSYGDIEEDINSLGLLSAGYGSTSQDSPLSVSWNNDGQYFDNSATTPEGIELTGTDSSLDYNSFQAGVDPSMASSAFGAFEGGRSSLSSGYGRTSQDHPLSVSWNDKNQYFEDSATTPKELMGTDSSQNYSSYQGGVDWSDVDSSPNRVDDLTYDLNSSPRKRVNGQGYYLDSSPERVNDLTYDLSNSTPEMANDGTLDVTSAPWRMTGTYPYYDSFE